MLAVGLASAQVPTALGACAVTPRQPAAFFVTDRQALKGLNQYNRGIDSVGGSVLLYGRPAIDGNAKPGFTNISVTGATSCVPTDFFAAIKQAVPNGGGIMIFITGFHEDFSSEVADAATFLEQTHFPGPVVAFSWPTARVINYPDDESTSEWAEHDIRAFLKALHATPGLRSTPLTVVSHSLGARLAIVAIGVINPWKCAEGSCLKSADLFASDIDTYTLRNDFDDLQPGSCDSPLKHATTHRFIEYVSKGDNALETSEEIHGHSRAGNIHHRLLAGLPPPTNALDEMFLCSTVDTIDVSNYSSSPGQQTAQKDTGHFYYQNPVVLKDLLLAWNGVKPLDPLRNLTPLQAPKSPPSYFQIPRGR